MLCTIEALISTAASPSYKPVSYTHLDVYKRQDMCYNCVLFSANRSFTGEISTIIPREYKAVSYTHLDVYKRQTENNNKIYF